MSGYPKVRSERPISFAEVDRRHQRASRPSPPEQPGGFQPPKNKSYTAPPARSVVMTLRPQPEFSSSHVPGQPAMNWPERNPVSGLVRPGKRNR